MNFRITQKLIKEITDFMEEHEKGGGCPGWHYLWDDDIIRAFPEYKEEYVREALEIIDEMKRREIARHEEVNHDHS